ncbi:MAG: hypothetical protein RIR70_1288, partial [Pseudomonadota bacterium]
FYAGYWEFPGGKVEPLETPYEALCRELNEELGIRVLRANPWVTREFEYEHAHVRLNFFEVSEFAGEPKSHIHAALAWQRADEPTVGPMLPANAPVLRSLQLPRMMGITQAHAIGIEAQLAALEAALKAGLGLVQVREGPLEAAARRRFGQAVRALTRAHGALLLVNSDIDLAHEIEADGVHLPARQWRASGFSRPDFPWVGGSTHHADELAQAAQSGLDFVVLGPVLPTQSHPGEAGMGWAQFSALIKDYPLPVLAIGGLGRDAMDAARAAGAHGVAGIRGIWGQG